MGYPMTKTRRIMMRALAFAALFFAIFFVVLVRLEPVDAGIKDTSGQIDEFTGVYDWETLLDPPASASDYITYTDYREDYCLYATSVVDCATAASGKYIRFDTAEELYRFSIDVSLEHVYESSIPAENYKLSVEKISLLLSLNYILGGDINYATMGAKTFAPIGYWFTDLDSVLHKNVFTGTFDGRGFTISNLYVAGYDYMVFVDIVDLNEIDLAIANYYSMFTFNEGTIKNIGLINPTLELLDVHIDINKTANLVGMNTASGTVDHVFVVDNRTNVLDAGIRYKVGTATGTFTAAGIVHTNAGTFTNAYYVSKVVVNGSYINKFIIQPVLYQNNTGGTISNLVYDETVYLLVVTVGTSTFYIATPNDALAPGETTATLKSSSSLLNTETDRWYFYASDAYPKLLGLTWDAENSVYLINNAIDLIAFSRVIEYISQNNGVSYPAADYLITTDIDMSEVSANAYETPIVNFTGTLSGLNPEGIGLDDNFYIYNLYMTNGIVRETNYYAGLFSIISAGTVSDLNIADSSITLTNTETYYSNVFGIGMIAGRMIGGTIQNVQIDVTINLGTASMGETHAGMLVGRASGIIDQVSVSGTLTAGTHTFNASLAIAPRYYIGGILGSATVNQITISNTVNNADISGFSTTSTFSMASGYYAVAVKMGGIVGYLINTSSIHHQLVDVANKGDITVLPVTTSNDVSGYSSTQNVGGVFGELSGYAPILESGGNYLFANLYNIGAISAVYGASRATIRAAGIGTSNTSQSAEYALMFNHGGYSYTSTGFSGNTHFRYTGTIMDVSVYNAANTITVSRAYNHADFTFTTAYFITFSPLYLSINNNNSVIRYSANYGDLTYMNSGGATTITMGANVTVSGITASTKVDFENVTNYGDITLANIAIGAYTLSIGGLTNTLTSGKKIVNCLNQGNIVFGKIYGSGNIYVGGLATYNYSGDLQSQDASSQPIATIGIMNSINYGNINTSYSATNTLYGITYTSNTFIGGITALNSGSIQDCANLGNIAAYNSYVSSTSTTFNTSSTYYAGIVSAYTCGVSVAGIAAITLAGTARIYDSANNGDVIALANRYARAGGILAASLYSEASAGGVTSGLGLADTIQSSILSNCLNYGSVTAVTTVISSYSTGTYTTAFQLKYGTDTPGGGLLGANFSPNTIVASNDRPGIYAAAGGVIGYGLCKMRRMINHGTISGTEVAGGIVGATYVLGGVDYPETTVDINTAINYGNIKSILNTNYASIDKFALDITDIDNYYMTDGNSFIFPASFTREEPRAKRGFGGIFGRLQRGVRGVMSTTGGSFDFIVNCNPNIDLIGRLDQDYAFCNSSRYFMFNDCIYYSARVNDTTQVVFTGFYYAEVRITAKTSSSPYTYTVTVVNIYTQIGSISTLYSSPGTTGVTYVSTTNYAVGTTLRYFYHAPINVPWITEDASQTANDDTEYIYDPDFPMRSDPALTEYIYYMEQDLLADRFQDAGSNPRPNGMYVLSTTAGSTYGLVLPSNIRTDDIRPIDEDHEPPISLLIDYNPVSTAYLQSLDANVIAQFAALKQSIFNDKSALLTEEESSFVLDETGGSDTVLTVPEVDYDLKTLTFTISMEAYLDTQTTVSYAITSAQISAYALIAKRAYDQYGGVPTEAQLKAYNNLLYPEKSDGISTDYAALLTLTLPSRSITTNTTLSLGFFTVYSEAFVNSDLFWTSAYYTDYEIFITFTPTLANAPTGAIGIDTVQFNGGSAVTVTDPADVTALGNVNAAGSIRFNFEDTANILASGYDFKNYITIKYSDGTVISPSYYTLTSIPVVINAGTGTYSVTITFSAATRSGNYYMYYKYYSSSPEYNVLFDKTPATAAVISALDYYSEDGSVVINGTTITSGNNVGNEISDLIGGIGETNFSTNVNTGIASYLSNTTFDVSFMTVGSFVISPFATLTSAYLNDVTITDGYKTYDIVYVITAEDGTTQTTYHHYITGRTIDLVSVLKNGNEVSLDAVAAAREDEMTIFTIDLGLDQNLDLYSVTPGGSWSYFGVFVTGTELDEVTPYTSEEIVGITYDATDYLHINMSYETLPGIYTFSFFYYRDGSTEDYITIATSLVITKNAGTNPFLTDIRFSQLANETNYPVIRITDMDGVVMEGTGYDPRVYFGGIDYDGADLYPYYFYRVDGQVSNTPLNEYMPYMLDYLPYGGTVARYAYNAGTLSWYWTTEVGAGSTPEEQGVLLADFTIDPETGLEPSEENELLILYRVTSEDGNTFTYYYITVTDVTYNVSLIFDVYYCTGVGQETCTLASQSVDFDNELVIITVKNIHTNGDDTVINVTNPEDYPIFSAVESLNNQVTQFHFTYYGAYRYSFGRNISGFYVFSIELPLDQYLNDLYSYEIEFSYTTADYFLFDASDYVAGLEGKYFYIEPSTRNRTRRFNIYIRSVAEPATNAPWGLFDFFRSWWD